MDIMQAFPIVLYTLGAVLIIVLIILGIKLINTIDKVNNILDDSYKKIQSLNGLFNTIDTITDTLASVNDKLVGAISSIIGKVFKKKKNSKKEID